MFVWVDRDVLMHLNIFWFYNFNTTFHYITTLSKVPNHFLSTS